ncbi:hypothetical protein WJ69_22960 [Burkholderia ubonensis]|uniref:hypothetical protein n=1 Tax=Burkholderia ubonensis TaxID=101571 RepID=UPI0007535C44|nr:hypothetical protein [Burkholderia ubonensis]KVO05564.1 hypothetical protein WJ69_22960 [Burkholderia ubonensis]
MATKTPIVLNDTQHSPLQSGDQLPGGAIALSADAGNRLAVGSDGGLFATESISADALNALKRGKDGGLFVVAATLPYYRWELGHSGQQNGGLGIDMGSWYRIDMAVGASGSLKLTIDADGYALLPAGQYLAFSGAHVSSQPNAGAQVENWQASFMFEQAYGFPGVYQYNSLFYKRLDTSPEDFTMAVSDVRDAGAKACFGFAKTNTHTVRPQGYIGIVKIA